ncbi:MAG: hypothetical protein ILP10_07935 [Lachnospiraceae bacterium]|nr:hypothetical protein [Lachnospiraceae bacterium]
MNDVIGSMFNIVGAVVFCTGMAIVLWLFSGAVSAEKKAEVKPSTYSVIEMNAEGVDGYYR